MNNKIKSWLITAEAPVCGTDTYYSAFSVSDPTNDPNFPYDEIVEELWDNYNYLLHLEDEEYESEEEEEEAWDEARENWNTDCSIWAQEMGVKELEDYTPGGPRFDGDIPEIIFDERNN